MLGYKEVSENPDEAKKTPEGIIRFLRYSTDLTIGCLFDIEAARQKLQSKEKRIDQVNKSSNFEVEQLKQKLMEKDGELKQVAKRMQNWKLNTAKSLASKLEKKIANELAIRREQQHNSQVERWLSSNGECK